MCLNLHLGLDKEGIIRVKTSLAKCPNLTFDQICPILIPAKSLYTNLVIAHNHVNSDHMSIHYTRSKLTSSAPHLEGQKFRSNHIHQILSKSQFFAKPNVAAPGRHN